MSSLLSVAASGLAAAGLRFATAARTAAGVEPARRIDPPRQAERAAVADDSVRPSVVPPFELPDPVVGLVDLKFAVAGYKAQIAVFQAADRQQKDFLQIVA